MKDYRKTISILCVMAALGGCSSTVIQENNKPSVTYSNDTINNDESPPIEDNTPVGKAITIMESSNPELITDYHMINESNEPQLVASHIETQKDKRWFIPAHYDPGHHDKGTVIVNRIPKTEKIESTTLPEQKLTPAQRFKAVHHVVTPTKQSGAFSFND